MEICSGESLAESHEEIAYECSRCPLCEEIENRKVVEEERDNLQTKLDNIE